MSVTENERLERATDALIEATEVLREANDRLERWLGTEAPKPKPQLALVKDEADDA